MKNKKSILIIIAVVILIAAAMYLWFAPDETFDQPDLPSSAPTENAIEESAEPPKGEKPGKQESEPKEIGRAHV